LVNLTVKKIYCTKCQKLRRVQDKKTGDKNEFICVKCGSVIWQKEGLNWKYKKKE
jgi:hypothetical protein